MTDPRENRLREYTKNRLIFIIKTGFCGGMCKENISVVPFATSGRIMAVDCPLLARFCEEFKENNDVQFGDFIIEEWQAGVKQNAIKMITEMYGQDVLFDEVL